MQSHRPFKNHHKECIAAPKLSQCLKEWLQLKVVVLLLVGKSMFKIGELGLNVRAQT